MAQTKVSDSNLERFAAEIQVCCRRCLNAQMSGFMLSRCLASLSRRHKSLLRLLYKSISLALTFRMPLMKSNYFFCCVTCIWVCHSMFKVQAKHHISWRSGAFQRPACRVSKLYFDGKCLGSVKVHPLPNLHLSPICRTEMIQLSNFNTKETSDLDLNFQMVERSKSGAHEHGRDGKVCPMGCARLFHLNL